MSLLKPRSLFSSDFSDGDESSSPEKHLSDDDEQLNSSSDSLMNDFRRPIEKKRLESDTELDSPFSYRKIRALRLFGSPQSPKTLLKQSELEGKNRTVDCVQSPRTDPYDHNHNVDRGRRTKHCFSSPLETHINPFNHSGLVLSSLGKRRRDSGFIRTSFNDSLEDCDCENEFENEFKPNKRMCDGNSRYLSEFLELEEVGKGEFGSVLRCVNRMDGCEYAIKKIRRPIKGTADERRALNEVYAHAVLGHHPHFVRYFSAWAEHDHMLIQNEFCNGGSLAQAIEEKNRMSHPFPEADVKQILLHIALGLCYIHSLNLAHMDIKPGNIFITKKPKLFPPSPYSSDDGFEDSEVMEEEIVYKIGDLGHVTSISSPQVEEGDCRYLPLELLRDDYAHLPKADIFALGLTIFEVCGGGPLPKNGEQWHSIRDGNLSQLPLYSEGLHGLLKHMTQSDPECRPSSAQLVQEPSLVPDACKTREQLSRELFREKLKNQKLERQLEMASLSLKKSSSVSGRISRLIGRKSDDVRLNRSTSVTF